MMVSIEKVKQMLQSISPWPWDIFKLHPSKNFTLISDENNALVELNADSKLTNKQYFLNSIFIAEAPQIIFGLIDGYLEQDKIIKEKNREIERLRNQISDLYSSKMTLDSIKSQLNEFSKKISPQDEYEYKITEGSRKMWDGSPDLSKDGWEQVDWERFDAHEEIL